MADKERDEENNRNESSAQGSSGESQTGDPGRTPGTAEGDEETVDEDLRQKEGQE